MDHGICWSSPSSYGRSGRPTSDRIAVATVMVVFYVANRRVNVSTVDLLIYLRYLMCYRIVLILTSLTFPVVLFHHDISRSSPSSYSRSGWPLPMTLCLPWSWSPNKTREFAAADGN